MGQAVLVLDVGKTHSKLTLQSLEGGPPLRRVRANAEVRIDKRAVLDAPGIEAWMMQTIAELAAEAQVVAIVPVGHGAAAALVAGDTQAAPVLDYEAAPPASRYGAERDPFARTLSPRLPAGLNLGAQLDWQERLYPELFSGDARIVPWPQYWAFRLSGEPASEVTSLGCHTDLWFPAEARYSDLARRRAWDERFAPMRLAGEVLGRVRADIARATGLPRNCMVLCGAHDSNASLRAARAAPEAAVRPFCLISTGTWFVAMQSRPTAPARLDEGRDTLGNVDQFGEVVPSARFMGGREFAAIVGEDMATTGSLADARRLIRRGVATRPSFVQGCGPYPDLKGAIIGEPATAGERAALASLHVALMASDCLDLIAAEGPVVIEGRFAADKVFPAALAALRPHAPVYCLAGADGVALGAASLWAPRLADREPAARVSPLAADIRPYADRWRERARPTGKDRMTYPAATADQIAFFNEHGWLVVEGAVPQSDLDALEGHCEAILESKETLANDWAWDEKEAREDRSFRIVQSSPSFVWKEIREQAYRKWLVAFGESLMSMKLQFWYDQFLAKPPGRSTPTWWHQDEGYWGRNLFDKGVTGWIPLQDVDAVNGCMHFIDGGHKLGVLPHHLVEGLQSDLLTCEVDEARQVICPIRRGDVTFHHSKTPHMTNANTGSAWRKAVTNHMQAVGAGGEGDHYPWKITVNQRTGERVVPESRPLEEGL